MVQGSGFRVYCEGGFGNIMGSSLGVRPVQVSSGMYEGASSLRLTNNPYITLYKPIDPYITPI